MSLYSQSVSKRLIALLLALLMLLSMLPAALAEEDDDEQDIGSVSQELVDEMNDLDRIEDDEPVYVVGEVYHEKNVEDFDRQSPAIYTAKTIKTCILYSARDINSPKVFAKDSSRSIEILSVGIVWCVGRVEGNLGYIKRDKLTSIERVDKVNTPPYGVLKSTYIATTKAPAHVRKSMSDQDQDFVVLDKGSKVSIWKIMDGWAIVIYMRNYGYISLTELTDLIPVSPTDTPLRSDTPIAAYTSFYKMVQTDANIGRIHNIANAASRLCRIYQPGEAFNYNTQVGPFRVSNGYEKAPVLVNGTTVLGTGGGVCQVSSTLYNALLQLPGVTILQRRPHGPSGASYLPHGVDAASGGTNLNLRFRNDYSFPIRVEAQSMGDGALYMAIYRADME
ncbi:MAG: VanW family protein [Clostridia bacterium]|nr:VanW family protein [Clostridia bacterium]